MSIKREIEWISVKDQMPREYECVLVTDCEFWEEAYWTGKNWYSDKPSCYGEILYWAKPVLPYNINETLQETYEENKEFQPIRGQRAKLNIYDDWCGYDPIEWSKQVDEFIKPFLNKENL